MKKLIFIVAVAFTACNSAETNCPATCDSTKCDSVKIDTLCPRGEVDTTILKTVK